MTDYKKIKASIVLEAHEELHTPEFREKLKDYELYFGNKLLEPISNIVGLEGWAINFIQVSAYSNHFFVDIYVDNPEWFLPIKNLCESYIDKEFKISFFHRGTVEMYLVI